MSGPIQERTQYLREIHTSVGTFNYVKEEMRERFLNLICMTYESASARAIFRLYMKEDFNRFFDEKVLIPLCNYQSEHFTTTTDELQRIAAAVNVTCVQIFFQQKLKLPEDILKAYDNPETFFKEVAEGV